MKLKLSCSIQRIRLQRGCWR